MSTQRASTRRASLHSQRSGEAWTFAPKLQRRRTSFNLATSTRRATTRPAKWLASCTPMFSRFRGDIAAVVPLCAVIVVSWCNANGMWNKNAWQLPSAYLGPYRGAPKSDLLLHLAFICNGLELDFRHRRGKLLPFFSPLRCWVLQHNQKVIVGT